VEPSTSPWNSPALIIRKANYDASRSDDLSNYRMIVDFRKANLQVAGSYQPLVDSQSIFNQIGEAKGRFFHVVQHGRIVLSDPVSRRK
jgi:hypothetical protein